MWFRSILTGSRTLLLFDYYSNYISSFIPDIEPELFLCFEELLLLEACEGGYAWKVFYLKKS